MTITPKTTLIAALIISVNIYLSGCETNPVNSNQGNKDYSSQHKYKSVKGQMIMGDFHLTPVEFVRNSSNLITNQTDKAFIIDNKITIPPHSSRNVMLKNEPTVTLTTGEVTKTYSTIPNKKNK